MAYRDPDVKVADDPLDGLRFVTWVICKRGHACMVGDKHCGVCGAYIANLPRLDVN